MYAWGKIYKMDCQHFANFLSMRHILIALCCAVALHAAEPLVWNAYNLSDGPRYSAAPRRSMPARQTSLSGQNIYNDQMLRLNVGMGPAATFLTGTLSDQQWSYFGIALDVYLAIPSAALAQTARNIDPAFRKFVVSGFEQEYRPAYLGLIPTHLYLNPEVDKIGLMGATWQMATLTLFSVTPIQEFSWKIGARLPTITIAKVYGDSTVLEKSDWLFGIGASLHTKGVFHFSPRMNMSLEWTSTFYLPGDDMGIQPAGTQGIEKQWYVGTFGWLINYRFGLARL